MHRDELIARLRRGESLPGFSYDPVTDAGSVSLYGGIANKAPDGRIKEIREAILSQQIDHNLSYGDGSIHASVSLRNPKELTSEETKNKVDDRKEKPEFYSPTFPVIYAGEFNQPPAPDKIESLLESLAAIRQNMATQALSYQDPVILSVVLHETAEVGLVENMIRSKDRRWLCDGTANYVAWKAIKEVFGAAPAGLVYDLEAQLQSYASLQKKIRLRKWPAVENQPESERLTQLNKAHYAFAARAIFLIAERHGEDAIPLLWQDVAKADLKRAAAKTFARALSKRYGDNLNKLVATAESAPLPSISKPK